jgi:serine protease
MPRSLAALIAPLCLTLGLAAPALAAPAYVPGKVVVGLSAPIAYTADVAQATTAAPSPNEQVLTLHKGESVAVAVHQLRRRPGVAYAVPDYIAHASGSFVPNDAGETRRATGWEQAQWNFLPLEGVNAPAGWANLIAEHHPGAKGVTIAVLDTGAAYRNWKTFKRSPDFAGTRFVAPYDVVDRNQYPLDRDGHGTFVTGVIAEQTNNRFGMTGLAYGASIMPVRVLGADGTGDATTIARGIRYAVQHGAQVINLSLEFSLDVSPSDIPDILSAIRYAHDHGVVVVAAAGNEGVQQIAYPAKAPDAISVGATTKDRCLADYSNAGGQLDLVAPGGNDDSSVVADPDCHPNRSLPDIVQMTFFDSSNPNRFGYPGGWYGTSMASPHVAAAAAMVIASGMIGRHPTPDAILKRLEQTADPLGAGKPNADYGFGMVDVGAATAPTPASAAHR